MTAEEFGDLLSVGHETVSLEFKPGAKRENGDLFHRVVRGVLAMANARGGGRIVLGVEEGTNGLLLKGVPVAARASWNYDDVSAAVNAYADPYVHFDREEIKYKNRTFIILRVHEDEVLVDIRKRGYWDLEVRPVTFRDVRIEKRTDLVPLVDKSRITLRGWDFPHVPRDEQPIIDKEWAGHYTDWDHHLEAWRMYRSGQFVMLSGVWYDWRDHSGWWPPDAKWKQGSRLGVYEAVALLTEFTRFGANLAATDAGDESMYLRVKLVNTKDRELYMDLNTRLPLWEGRRAAVDAIEVEREIASENLLAQPDEVARKIAVEFFEYFNWENPATLVAELQGELLRR